MKKSLLALAAFVMLVSCSSKPEQSFKGKEYQLLQAQNNAVVTLGFAAEEPRFFGKIVNNYFGEYKLNGNKIKFNPAGSTMMMGPEPEMEAEQNFLGILPHIVSWHFVNQTLVLTTDNGQELAFKPVGNVEAK